MRPYYPAACAWRENSPQHRAAARGDDGLGDLILHREHVGEVAIVAFRPKVASGGDIIELCRDAHAFAAPAQAALDHIADAEFLGDLLDVHCLFLVDE